MKRAGILIGLILIVLALALFGVSEWIEKRNIEGINKGVQEDIIVDNADINETEQENNVQEVIKEVVKEVVVEKTVEKKISGVTFINEKTLGEPYVEKESIVVIASKRLLLIDESTETSDNKMLTYCFDVLTTDNVKLVLFMTEKVYNSYEIGDKLLVNYRLYKNDKGLMFPVVLSVSAVS